MQRSTRRRNDQDEANSAKRWRTARAANALAARTAKGERRVRLILDLDERVEHHRAARVHVDLERVHRALAVALRVVPVDLKVLELVLARRRRGGRHCATRTVLK